jgi:hypothetical protein
MSDEDVTLKLDLNMENKLGYARLQILNFSSKWFGDERLILGADMSR